jgi:hypothetical protein
LGEVVRILGTEHSRLRPGLYAAILLPLDGVSLVVQIAGFAFAFEDASTDAGLGTKTQTGMWIVTAGLGLQMATLAMALAMTGIVFIRAARAYHQYGYTTFHRDVGYIPLTTRFQVFAGILPMACLCLLGRLAYRIAALADGGLQGRIAKNEGLFAALEGLLVGYALVSLVTCHPGIFLEDGKRQLSEDTVPFVQHETILEEASKVYLEQDRKLARNTSKNVTRNIGRAV